MRVATPADVPEILSFYRALSPQSLLMRFFVASHDDPALERAAHVASPEAGLVMIAVRPLNDREQVVGEARYELTAGGAYEFGLAILDSWQRQGLGCALLNRLRAEARQRGVAILRGLVRTDNTAMLRLLLSVGCAVVEPASGGEVTVDISTEEGMPGWPDRGDRPRVVVESRSWWESAQVAALRDAGYEVRMCHGPSASAGRGCPMLESGTCRLVAEADVVAWLLPASDAQCAAVADEHVRRHPDRLVRTGAAPLLEQVRDALAHGAPAHGASAHGASAHGASALGASAHGASAHGAPSRQAVPRSESLRGQSD